MAMKKSHRILIALLVIASVAGITAVALTRNAAHVRKSSAGAGSSESFVTFSGNGQSAGAPVIDGAVKDGPQPSAFSRPANARDGLPPGLQVVQNLQLDPTSSRRVAAFGIDSSGSVFLAHSARGLECIMLAFGDGTGSVGCNPGKAPFQGKPVWWTSGGEGGPSAVAMTSYALAGVALPAVSRIELVDSVGGVHDLPINADGAFEYEEPLSLLKEGILPAQLQAYSVGGKLLVSEAVRAD